MKYLSILFALLTFTTPALSAYERTVSRTVNGKEMKIANKFLALTILPERSGRISSIRVKDRNMELLTPAKVSSVEETPLFFYMTDNMNGIYELFWSKKINGTVGMSCTEIKADKITLDGNFYGNDEIKLYREISLTPDALEINIHTVFTNIADKPAVWTPWVHLVGTPISGAQIPCAPGKHHRAGFGNIGSSELPKLFTFSKFNNYLVPGANWIGVRCKGKNLVWALTLPAGTLDKEGVFYSWGNGKVDGIQSSEVVWPKFNLAPKASGTIDYSFLIFPGLDSLNGIWGHTGVSLMEKNGKAVLTFSASRKEAARQGNLHWQDDNGKMMIHPFKLPELAAGQSHQIILPLKKLPKTAKIMGAEHDLCQLFL